MKKEEILTKLKLLGVNISLFDFRIVKDGIWGYKKTDKGYIKKVVNGKVDVDGVEFIYKSKEYFDYMLKNKDAHVKRLYDTKSFRQGIFLANEDLEHKDAKGYVKEVFN